jgi:hypothetical protein
MLFARYWVIAVASAGCAGWTTPERGPPDRRIEAKSSSRHSNWTVHIDSAIDTLIRDHSSTASIDQATSTIGYTSTTETVQVTQQGDECVDTQERLAQLTARDIAVFDPSAGVLFPGSLVALNGIADGRLDSRNVPPANRQPFTVAITDVASSVDAPPASELIVRPSYGALEAARIKLIDANQTPSKNFSYTLHEYHSADQTLLSAGISTHWISGLVSASLARNTSRYKTGVMLSFQQRYYTMGIDPLDRPSAFFQAVSARRLAAWWRDAASNPIGYIASVSYGRWTLLTAESTRSAEQLKAALDGALQAASTAGTALSAEDRAILADSRLQLVILGRNHVTVTAIADDDIVASLQQSLGSSDDDQVRFGVPISFRVNHLGDNSPKVLESTTSFSTQQRSPFVLENFRILFHTSGDKKDRDTAVNAWVWDNNHPVISGSDHGDNEYKDGSDHTFEMSGAIPARSLAGKLLRVCISPRRRDTWKFDVALIASNGYRVSFTGRKLDHDRTCMVTPLPSVNAACQ